ncbi:MAG TPA: lysyl endopeptidase, partial [candidate division Zixibacteria bacterium]|nr:lysyl endopeptidase [candidate division Zixibacteria bacterium]
MKSVRLLLLAVALCSAAAVSTMAQISQGGSPVSFLRAAKAAVPTVTMGAVDTQKLLAEDQQQEKLGEPYRFGYPFDVQYDLTNSGIWEDLPDGTKLWRLKISCPGAYSINLIFDRFHLPDGAKLYIYNEDHSQVIGAFTSANNKPYDKFATAPVKGDVSILEYSVPSNVGYPGELRVSRIVHAYKNVFFDRHVAKEALDFGNSGSCNNNVNCPVGLPWADQIRSVAMITTGGGFRICSGALVNNVRQDFTPYFLTANHCLGGEETWVFIFNYESPTCANIDGPTNMSVSGSTLLATNTYSDFALLQLSAEPPDS